jgi:hypothetical protein
VGTNWPIVWYFAGLAGVGAIAGLGELFDSVQRFVVEPIASGSYGIETLFAENLATVPTQTAGGILMHRLDLPPVPDYVIANIIWLGLGVSLLFAVARRRPGD